MKTLVGALVLTMAALPGQDAPTRPRPGKVQILKASEVRAGMKGTAWTVFSGSTPEPIPVEVIGLWRNAWGPKQDVILAKLGGQAGRTNVAGGMSGSPVYVDGKLIGAIALRISVFSPDAICGITPIELMMEIGDFDTTRPSDARTPDRAQPRAGLTVPGELLAQVVSAGASPEALRQSPVLTPIETPLAFSGFHEQTLREFGPLFQQNGLRVVQGGSSSNLPDARPAPGWQNALAPGDAVSAVLVTGDMSMSAMGTVTYNDGQRVLAFGHPFFNLGPVDMPMSKSEVLMTLSSSFAPNKFGNATEIVGAFSQDRHSGILGVPGRQAATVPVSLKVRSFSESGAVNKEKELKFHVFLQQRWTPQLMMITLFNAILGLNDFADETTYRLSGEVELDGQPNLSITTMLAASEMPIPAPMILAGYWGDKFNRLFLNTVKTPRLRRVNAVIDLLPERRVATIEQAWLATNEAVPGADLPVKVFLRPYRGERLMREFRVRIPAGLPAGEHRILLSDADTLNRMQSAAGFANRFLDLPQMVSLLNQERTNNKMYVSLVQARPTLYAEDKTLPSLPASVANVLQTGRSGSRFYVTSGETAHEQMAIPFDLVINGSYSLRIQVK